MLVAKSQSSSNINQPSATFRTIKEQPERWQCAMLTIPDSFRRPSGNKTVSLLKVS